MGVVLAAAIGVDAQRRAPQGLDAALTTFWAADSPTAAAAAEPQLIHDFQGLAAPNAWQGPPG